MGVGSSQYITSGGKYCLFLPLLVTLGSISQLRWDVPDFFIIKVLMCIYK